ncbi:MAG: hypothetical protein EOO81_08225 [Oxalobacteraceae bacterium]|nr:MAG: hypothetical protein EOO81_08225 [Oxalobacteraceae bacterium]
MPTGSAKQAKSYIARFRWTAAIGWRAVIERRDCIVYSATMSRRRRLLSMLWDASHYRPQNKWMVSLAVGLVMVPATILFPATLMFFVEPLWMFKDWDTFGFFFAFYGVPWVCAGVLVYVAATVGDEVSDVTDRRRQRP